jgi:hypothetical protein
MAGDVHRFYKCREKAPVLLASRLPSNGYGVTGLVEIEPYQHILLNFASVLLTDIRSKTTVNERNAKTVS